MHKLAVLFAQRGFADNSILATCGFFAMVYGAAQLLIFKGWPSLNPAINQHRKKVGLWCLIGGAILFYMTSCRNL